MQATVASFEAASGAGTAVLDDGTRVSFDEAAFAASGLRHLRPGQRVRLESDRHGHVVRVTIPTLP